MDAYRAASYFPWFVRWGPSVIPVVWALLMGLATGRLFHWLAGRAIRRTRDAEWQDRAVVLEGVRDVRNQAGLMAVGIFAGVYAMTHIVSPVPAMVRAALVAVATYTGYRLGLSARTLAGEFSPTGPIADLRRCVWMSSTIPTLLAIIGVAAIFVAPPARYLLGVLFILAFSAHLQGVSYHVARHLGQIVELDGPVADRIQRMAADAGLRLDEILIANRAECNAYALPTCHTIVFTKGAVETLSDRELEALAAHELAHLDEPPTSAAARWAGIAAIAGIFGIAILRPPPVGWTALLVVFGIIWASSYLFQQLNHSIENETDRSVESFGASPETYASALVAMHRTDGRPIDEPAPTHPALRARIEQLGADIDLPTTTQRPPWWSRLYTSGPILVCLAGFSALFILPPVLASRDIQHNYRSLWHATRGVDADIIRDRGQDALFDDEPTRALAMFVTCTTHDPDTIECPLQGAHAALSVDACDAANELIEHAESRMPPTPSTEHAFSLSRARQLAAANCQ